MPRLFVAASSHEIRTAPGGVVGANANCTFAAICRKASNGTHQILIQTTSVNPSGLVRFGVNTSNQLRMMNSGNTASNASFTLLSSEGWVLLVAQKASGTVAARFHKYVYSTRTWTHGDGTTAINNGSALASDGHIRIGNEENQRYWDGDIAVLGVWSGAEFVSDSEVEEAGLAFSLQSWQTRLPAALWLFDQGDTGQLLYDITGKGANQTSIVGTSVTVNSAPLFNRTNRVRIFHVPSGAAIHSASTTLALALTLSPDALRQVPVSSTLGLALALSPTALGVGVASTTLGLALTLSPTGLEIELASTTLGLSLALTPTAVRVQPASTTLGLALTLSPSGVEIGVASTTLGLNLGLAPTAQATRLATTTLGLVLTLSPTAELTAQTALSLNLGLTPTAIEIGVAQTTLGLALALSPAAQRTVPVATTLGLTLTLTPAAQAFPVTSVVLGLVLTLSPVSASTIVSTASLGLFLTLSPVAAVTLLAVIETVVITFGGGGTISPEEPAPALVQPEGFGSKVLEWR